MLFIDNLEDFLNFLGKRLIDEVFYEYKESTSSELSNLGNVEIILHFLSKIENSIVLYETKVLLDNLNTTNIDKQVFAKLKDVFNKFEIKLIKGKIREIFLSYS